MKIKYLRHMTSVLLILMLCMVHTVIPAAAAEQTGGISFTVKNAEGNPQNEIQMKVFRVANTSGVLTEDFEETGLNEDALLKEKNSRSSVEVLRNHVMDHEMKGWMAVTGENGTARLDGLDAGVYMVFCDPGQMLTFEPFLVTVKSGNVTASPKISENPETPQNPDNPGNPDDIENPEEPGVPEVGGNDDESESPENQEAGAPTIPQTGENYWLVWILLGAGALLSMIGVWCLRREEGVGHE